MAFKYSADYYDPSKPTEEEEANKEHGEDLSQVYDKSVCFLLADADAFQVKAAGS